MKTTPFLNGIFALFVGFMSLNRTEAQLKAVDFIHGL